MPIPEEPTTCGASDPDFATPEPTAEELEMCEALENMDPEDTELVDADKSAYDKEAISKVRTEAVRIARTEFQLELSSGEAQTALGLFPKV